MKKLLLLPILFLSFAQAETIQCDAIEVITGDTFRCTLKNKPPVKIKLHGIISPKNGQLYSDKSKEKLDEAFGFYRAGNNVNINITKINLKNNEVYAQAYYAGICSDSICITSLIDIPMDLVSKGYVWCDRLDSSEICSRNEKEAREAKRGLWADSNPIPPWERRKK